MNCESTNLKRCRLTIPNIRLKDLTILSCLLHFLNIEIEKYFLIKIMHPAAEIIQIQRAWLIRKRGFMLSWLYPATADASHSGF
jgi:hypothetical protein